MSFTPIRVLTVTLNPSIDRTYIVPNFQPGELHRCADFSVRAGGKGLNVSLLLVAMGGRSKATGFLAGDNGRYVADRALQQGVEYDAVWLDHGETRLCLKISDPATGSLTELNELGPEVSAEQIDQLKQKLTELCIRYKTIVLSGSACRGIPDSYYAQVITALQNTPIRVVLDASGEMLREGAAAKPWMLKPNLDELTQLTGHTPRTPDDAADLASQLVNEQTEYVMATMGAAGMVLACASGCWHCPSIPIELHSSVGCGDSALAGFLMAHSMGMSAPEKLQWACAAAAARACTPAQQMPGMADVLSLVERCFVRQIG